MIIQHQPNKDNNVGVIDVSTSQHKVDDIDQEEHTLLIASFRKRFGDIALNLMYDYCDILSSQQQDVVTIDIGEFADFVHEVIDTIGVIGLYDDIFNVYGFSVSIKDKLKREKSKIGFYHAKFIEKPVTYTEVIHKIKKNNICF